MSKAPDTTDIMFEPVKTHETKTQRRKHV